MRKIRVLYMIMLFISFILIFTTYIYTNNFMILLLSPVVFFLYFLLRKNEVKPLFLNRFLYDRECNCNNYISSMQDFEKKCFFTKKQRAYFKMNYARAYLDAGKFDKAFEILTEIDNMNIAIDDRNMPFYLFLWADYFYYNNYDEKLKALIEKIKNILATKSNINIRNGYYFIYNRGLSYLNILNSTDLNFSRTYFTNQLNTIRTNINAIVCYYNLALIDLEEGNMNLALEKLNNISSNPYLYVSKKANELIKLHKI